MSTHAGARTRPGLTLPADWDPERDVLVWLGAAGPGMPAGERVFRVPAGAAEAGGERVLRDADELYRTLVAMPGAAPRHALVHRSADAPAEQHQRLAEVVGRALRTRASHRKTVDESGLTWLRQGLANLPALADCPSIVPLAGALRGRPCILVSPGPSLERNVAQLRELSGRAVIVSGTHALSALARAGVTPHVVVCADPGDLTRHWAGLDLTGVEAFVVAATCRPETHTVPARRRFSFAGNANLDAWLFEALGEEPFLGTGGSVACSMLSLALHLGCGPIAFVGQDLSFGARYYAAGGLDGDAMVTPSDGDKIMLVKPPGAEGIGKRLEDGRLRFARARSVVEVPGWGGGTVRTTAQLKVFLDWFEHVAPGLAEGTRLLNCTEGGARIAGMEHLPLSSASAGWGPLEEDVGAALERAREGLDPRKRRAKLREWARRTLTALEECVRLARACRGLAGPGDTKALARSEKRLAQALRRAPLVSLVAQGEILAAREAARAARTVAQNLVAARRLYGVVEKAGAELAEPLRKAWGELG